MMDQKRELSKSNQLDSNGTSQVWYPRSPGGEKGFLSMEEWWDSLFGHNGDLDSLSKPSATILKNVG